MKYLYFFIIFFFPFILKTQIDTNLILIKNLKVDNQGLFLKKAIIFKKPYDLYENDNIKYFFTPSINEIIIAETIFYKKYNLLKMSDNYISCFKIVINVRKKYLNYYRQYYGFVNKNDEKVIFIQFLNFKNKYKANKYFSNWEKRIIIGSGEFYEQNSETYIINLSKNTLEYY